jgi:hypothetical protein
MSVDNLSVFINSRLCVPGNMDYGFCDGYRARTSARHQTLPSVTGHLSRQRATDSVGVRSDRSDGHSAVLHLVLRIGGPQASVSSIVASVSLE